jgi:hypothetical protein
MSIFYFIFSKGVSEIKKVCTRQASTVDINSSQLVKSSQHCQQSTVDCRLSTVDCSVDHAGERESLSMAASEGETAGLLGGRRSTRSDSDFGGGGGRRRSTSSHVTLSDDVPRVPPFQPDGSPTFAWGLGLALCTCGVSMVPWLVREVIWKTEHDHLDPFLDGEGFLAPSRAGAPPPSPIVLEGGAESDEEGDFEQRRGVDAWIGRAPSRRFDASSAASDVPEPLDMRLTVTSPVEIL